MSERKPKPKKKKKIVWFARGGNIAKSGPYKTQIEAVNAMRLVNNPKLDDTQPIFLRDIFVWPEEVTE
jgi:hypothetical protein